MFELFKSKKYQELEESVAELRKGIQSIREELGLDQLDKVTESFRRYKTW